MVFPILSSKVGLPLGGSTGLDGLALETIKPDAGRTHIKFAMEFQHGPRLAMVQFPGSLIGAFNSTVVDAVNLGSPDTIPPLEFDNVYCDKHDDGSIILPATDGGSPFEMPVVSYFSAISPDRAVLFYLHPDSGTAYLEDQIRIKRVSATVSQLRMNAQDAGAPANNIKILLDLDNVALEYQAQDLLSEFFLPNHLKSWNSDREITADKVELSCLLRAGPRTLGPPPPLCGEIPLTCAETTARVAGLRGTLPAIIGGVILPPLQNDLSFHPMWHTILEDGLRVLMARGLTLHFTGFSADALTIDPEGTVRLAGTENRDCSPAPVPPPSRAPTRGLARVSPTIGKGEFVGDRGNVIPFDLVPEVKIDWITAIGQPVFIPWTPVRGYSVPGAELPRALPPKSVRDFYSSDLPSGLKVSLELTRVATATCFSKPTRPPPDGG